MHSKRVIRLELLNAHDAKPGGQFTLSTQLIKTNYLAVEVVVDRTDETLSKITVVDGKGTALTVLVAREEFGPGGTTFARSNNIAAWTVFMTWSISSGERQLVINCPPCPRKAAF